jgi:nicotinamidase-related amidase
MKLDILEIARCLALLRSRLMTVFRFFVLVCVLSMSFSGLSAQELELQLRNQHPISEGADRFYRETHNETWQPAQTAVIVCDMWDAHHCVNAVRRGAELAPRIDAFVRAMRSRGATIIHAPSSCMEYYAQHPARLRAQATPLVESMPADIENWCNQIPAEEAATYPLDQSAGGEDDDPDEHRRWAQRLEASGRNPRSPWQAQTAAIAIDPKQDYLSDSGPEIWSILAERGISNVILAGVHTNMCVLGRPFGLRRLVMGGKNVVLARDLTDTMYDPQAWPYANHFTGTDLIISHIERYVCPTISSDQVLGGQEFRYASDRRPRLVMLIAEDEYKTETTLPVFAAKHLSQNFRVTTCYARESDPSKLVGIEDVASADALLVSVRRRALPTRDLELVREFAARGKPMIGIRTASHAFSLRKGEPPTGFDVWPEFDAEVWGGSYSGHHANNLSTTLELDASAMAHPIVAAAGLTSGFKPGGSLYNTAPLLPGTELLLVGSVPNDETPQPLAWTFVRNDGGRSFYTSLGHIDDFAQAEFETLLSAAIHWACDLELPALAQVETQNTRYASGGS